MKKRWMSGLFCLFLAVVSVLGRPALADAVIEEWWDYSYDVDRYVYVNASDNLGLFMREGPGTEYAKVNQQTIPMYTRIHISREYTAKNGWKWGYSSYKFPGETYADAGWVCLVETTTYDPTPTATPDPTPTATNNGQGGKQTQKVETAMPTKSGTATPTPSAPVSPKGNVSAAPTPSVTAAPTEIVSAEPTPSVTVSPSALPTELPTESPEITPAGTNSFREYTTTGLLLIGAVVVALAVTAVFLLVKKKK
ncbi:MAG: hypothetical protein IIY71_01465 [Oscillospiraceae bacterium]|nr:hypothetical protein [Oscillospiraceae bacterium]